MASCRGVVTLDRLNTLLKSIMVEGAGAALAACSDDLTLIQKMKTRLLKKAAASDQLCLVHLIVWYVLYVLQVYKNILYMRKLVVYRI